MSLETQLSKKKERYQYWNSETSVKKLKEVSELKKFQLLHPRYLLFNLK